MTLRNEWEFEYTASKLAEASKAKEEAHRGKLKWWEGKKTVVMERIKESGISVHESLAATYSNTKGLNGPTVQIEANMQRDLSECHMKIMEHNELVKTYNGWSQVLSANSESRLKLNHADWLFFFGKDSDKNED